VVLIRFFSVVSQSVFIFLRHGLFARTDAAFIISPWLYSFQLEVFMADKNLTDIKTVCGGMIRNPEDHPTAVYRGEKIYFCADSCLKAFEQDPEGYIESTQDHSH